MTDSHLQQACASSLEDLRQGALKHYQEASSAIHHWSSFVEEAILGHDPEKEKKTAVAFAAFISNHKLDFQPGGNGEWIGVDMRHYTNEELYAEFEQFNLRVPQVSSAPPGLTGRS